MPLLFGRKICVDVAGLTITEPRIVLEVSREIDSTQVQGKVDIYNLSKEHAARIRERGGPIVIAAGYPETVAEVFRGVVQRVLHVRENLAHVTRIMLGDQVRQRLGGVTVRSYEGAVAVRQIAADIADDLSLPLGPADNIPASATYENFYWTGPADAALSALLASVECHWYEADGVIRINRAGMVQSDAPVINLSPDTGLVGTPQRTDEGLRVKMLLNPAVVLGCRINLQSSLDGATGSWKPVAISHHGDNWQGTFLTIAELRELDATTPEMVA